MPSALSEHYLNTAESYSELTSRLHDRPPHQDRTLQHPNCVYQILKRHYARYTPEMVERTTGCPKDLFVKVSDPPARNTGPALPNPTCHAVGVPTPSVGRPINPPD